MPGTPTRRTLPTWREVWRALADEPSFDWCFNPTCQLDHRAGVAEWGRVHWDPDRNVTRRGIRRFLCLCYESSRVTLGTPRWKVIWQRAAWIRTIERRLHVNVTGTTSQVVMEKTEVRFLLRDPASRQDPDARRAWAWANGPTGERRKR